MTFAWEAVLVRVLRWIQRVGEGGNSVKGELRLCNAAPSEKDREVEDNVLGDAAVNGGVCWATVVVLELDVVVGARTWRADGEEAERFSKLMGLAGACILCGGDAL